MKPEATYQKLRGGYYTPKPIADFLAQWAIQSPDAQVLEPSCGDGNLLEAAVYRFVECGVQKEIISDLLYGVEIDPQEALKSVERLTSLGVPLATNQIYNGDFFSYCKAGLAEKNFFDAIIGNPPFIRYQNFLEEHRGIAFYLMQRAGLHPTRLTNSWVPFLVASTLLLNSHGRLAMVIPAELLQVNYAAELRLFLSNHYSKITLITFKRLTFKGIQQEIVLLLAEKNGDERTGIRTIELNNINDLLAYEHPNFSADSLKLMDHSTEKWTMYFLDQKEIDLLRELKSHPKLTVAADVLEVNVGIVTGLNEFFVLTEKQVEELSLTDYTQRIVGRSAHLQGLIFSEADWFNNVKKQFPAFLLNSPNVPFYLLPESLKQYVAKGQEQGWNKGYKCRIRNPWYVVPSIWVPHAFMLRQIHSYPKIIFNEAGATCTDTIHRVRLRNGTDGRILAVAFLNSLTFAFAEILGRSYGGGVLELEPKEAEQLLIPLNQADLLDLDELNKLLVVGKIDDVLDITDKVLLKQGLGLSAQDTLKLRGIWEKMRNRRINRK